MAYKFRPVQEGVEGTAQEGGEGEGSDGGLSKGASAGIAIAVIAGVLALLALVAGIVYRKRKAKQASGIDRTASGYVANTEFSQSTL